MGDEICTMCVSCANDRHIVCGFGGPVHRTIQSLSGFSDGTVLIG